jgi:hypothetical protein
MLGLSLFPLASYYLLFVEHQLIDGTTKRLQLYDLAFRVASKSEEGSRQSGVTSRLTAYWAPVIMDSAGYSEPVSAPC